MKYIFFLLIFLFKYTFSSNYFPIDTYSKGNIIISENLNKISINIKNFSPSEIIYINIKSNIDLRNKNNNIFYSFTNEIYDNIFSFPKFEKNLFCPNSYYSKFRGKISSELYCEIKKENENDSSIILEFNNNEFNGIKLEIKNAKPLYDYFLLLFIFIGITIFFIFLIWFICKLMKYEIIDKNNLEVKQSVQILSFSNQPAIEYPISYLF